MSLYIFIFYEYIGKNILLYVFSQPIFNCGLIFIDISFSIYFSQSFIWL